MTNKQMARLIDDADKTVNEYFESRNIFYFKNKNTKDIYNKVDNLVQNENYDFGKHPNLKLYEIAFYLVMNLEVAKRLKKSDNEEGCTFIFFVCTEKLFYFFMQMSVEEVAKLRSLVSY